MTDCRQPRAPETSLNPVFVTRSDPGVERRAVYLRPRLLSAVNVLYVALRAYLPHAA